MLTRLVVAALIALMPLEAHAALEVMSKPIRTPLEVQEVLIMRDAFAKVRQCVAQEILHNARYASGEEEFGDLIVDAMTPCKRVAQDMMDIYDYFHGPGTGKEFFLGPYLDRLPQELEHALHPVTP